MKKFKFRLQSVLDAREKALEDRQLEMAQIQAKLTQQQKHLDDLYDNLKTTKNNLEALLSAGSNIDLTLIRNYQCYIPKLKEDIRNQHKLIADTEIELDDKKAEVLEALKAKTMLEKLKEKGFKEFLTEIEKADLLMIDEIATGRYKRTI